MHVQDCSNHVTKKFRIFKWTTDLDGQFPNYAWFRIKILKAYLTNLVLLGFGVNDVSLCPW